MNTDHDISTVSAPQPDRRWYTPLRFLATFYLPSPEAEQSKDLSSIAIIEEPLEAGKITEYSDDEDRQNCRQVNYDKLNIVQMVV